MADTGSIASPPRGGASMAAWAVAAVLAVIGIVAYVMQSINGMEGYVNEAPWGIYLAAFYVAAGMGAGLLLVTGLGSLLGFVGEAERPALFAVSVAAYVVAGLDIVADLGAPLSSFLILAAPNPESPLLFDMYVLIAGIVFGIVAALVSRKPGKHGAFAAIAIVVGAATLAVESWLLVAASGREAWGVLLGFAPALIQAVALALAVLAWRKPEDKRFSVALGVAVAAAVIAACVDAASGTGMSAVGMQLSAFLGTPVFWCAAIAGVAAVVVALVGMSRVAAVLGVFSVAFIKVAALWAAQAVPLVVGAQQASGFGVGPVEVAVIVGTVGIGLIVYLAASNILGKSTEEKAVTE